MSKRALGSALLVVGLFAMGCTESVTPEPDAEIIFDPPPMIDAGTDAGPVINTPVGDPCAADTDCGDGLCIGAEEGYPMGYCSSVCITGDECPTGSTCIQTGGGGMAAYCFADCDPAATERECRAYYGCASGFGLPAPVCLPGCTDDTDCPPDRTCNPTGGGECYNPAASFGDACASSTDCPDLMRCQSESRRGYPGGMCQAFGCDPAADTGCPADAHCIPGGMSGFGRCIPSCTVDTVADDCRAAYGCTAPNATYPDRFVCTPACTLDTDCTDGRVCDTAMGTCG
jgi:hypothetical protein